MAEAMPVIKTGYFNKLLGVTVARQRHQADDALRAFQSGQYRVVEGPVEDFDPMPFEGNYILDTHPAEGDDRVCALLWAFSEDCVSSGTLQPKRPASRSSQVFLW